MEKPSRSYWSVAAMGLLWNLMGCLTYIAHTNARFTEQLPTHYQTVIAEQPLWATVAHMVAVFGGAVGCILLLLRRAVAVQLLGLSSVGAVLTLLYMVMALGLSGDVMLRTGVSVLVACILLWLAMAARARGWLR